MDTNRSLQVIIAAVIFIEKETLRWLNVHNLMEPKTKFKLIVKWPK